MESQDMPRLPQPGSDAGNWGNLLNDFLSTAHDSNGNLKAGSVTTSILGAGSVTLAKLAISNAPTSGQTLSFDGANLTWTTPSSSGSVPDATAGVKGLVQLAGDLGGTSSAPTVPGLASKANTSDVVTLAGAQTVSGAKNFTGGIQAGGVALVTTSDARLTDARTPADNTVSTAKLINDNVTTAKIADGAITEPKLAAANSPVSGQVLSYNGTNFTWVSAATGSAGDPTVGGDLSGTASNAQIVANAVGATEIASNAVISAKIADANVTTAKIADANVTTAKIADANVTTGKVADNAITEPKLAVSNAPATNQVLTWDGTALTWTTPATGGSGGSGSVWNAVTRSSAYTAVSGDFVICNTTSSGFTVTLPAPANGAYVTIKKLTNNVNAILVAPPNGVIDAGASTSSTISVNNYGQVADFVADGTTWHQVG